MSDIEVPLNPEGPIVWSAELPTARSPLRWYLIIAAVVSLLGGFLFGFDSFVISGAIGYLSRYFNLNIVDTGWAASCALAGCILGSASAGTVVDRLGLKKGLFLCATCFAISSVGIWSAGSFTQFSIWRIIAGFGIGGASIAAPMYIAEIAPNRYRGRLVTLYQLGIVIGALAAVFSDMLIQRMGNDAWNASMGWRGMFLVGIIPALLFGMMIVPSVESPRWLMKMGRSESAIHVLSKINDPVEVIEASNEIRESLLLEGGSLRELFTTFRRPLLLGIMLAGLNQISGITPLFSFLPEIFQNAGTATKDAFFQAVLVGLVNLVFTLLALACTDRAGRKTLIIAGTIVQFISFALVGWFYHVHSAGLAVLIGVMTFVAGHAFGNGVAVWVVISEIYPTKFRGLGMSIAITTLWVMGFLGNQLFPVMQRDFGSDGTFWCFSFGALVTVFLVAFLIPETKGYSLEEITRFWIS